MPTDNRVIPTMQNSNSEQFKRNLEWVISIFKSRDVLVMQAFKEGAKKWINTDFFKGVLTTAINYLAESDTETFYWAFYSLDLNLSLEIKQDIAVTVAQQLIAQGCVLGRDFSSTLMGNLLINEKAAAALANIPYVCSSVLLQEILHPLKS
jgi:hypothetical protein